MPTVPFFDIDIDTIIEITLSEEDALRAKDDIVFATSFLEGASKQQQTITTSIIMDPPMDFQDQNSEIEEEETSNIENEDSDSSYRWTESRVLLLLENYRASEKKFSDGKQSHKKMWDEIAKIMNEKGHVVTGPQCAAKLRSLKKTYKSTKDHNNKSGNNRRTWQFFEIMDDIFSKKAWCSPVAVASSTGLSTRNEGNSATETDGGCIYDRSSTSNEKTTAKSLLTKRLRQKEEHEKARNKRHKDRMEMDNKFLALFEKLVDKQ